jgi:ESCRT-II complex subunit VPS36
LQNLNLNDNIDSIKVSFRSGNGKEDEFHKKLKGAMVQRKWLLMSAPPIPQPNQRPSSPQNNLVRRPSDNLAGLAGLERRGQQLRQNNEMIIGNAFEDLEALMTSAKEVIALAERFSTQARTTNGVTSEADAILTQSASALGIATTRDTLGSDNLYISELSRNIAEFLTDDSKGILKREGGIMSLVDLWAVYNRMRGGVELVSPTDFAKAAEMWDKLSLPVRLRKFKSGLLVVQGRDRTDDKTIASILAWLKSFHGYPPEAGANWDWRMFGRGVTAQETAAWFSWSVGVAQEELEMCEERGALCREQGVDGLRFWENWFVNLGSVEQSISAAV